MKRTPPPVLPSFPAPVARLAVLAVLAVFGPLRPAAAADETIQNFKRYFNTYKDTAYRVEAVLTLEGLEDPAVVDLLLSKLKDQEPDVSRAIVRVFSRFKTRPPVDALLAGLKADKNEAVRVGLLRAIADGKYKDTAEAVTACLPDKSWEVRRRAVQALAAAGDPALAPAIAPLAADPEAAVRTTVLDALVALGSELAVAPAVAALGDPVWQVRRSALDVLLKIRHKDAIEPLIARLDKEEGLLLPDVGEALANLSGKEHGTDAAKWKAWWAEAKTNYVLPSKEAIAYLRGTREARTGGGGKGAPHKSGVVEYHGIDTPSRSILFVIDVSGSMEALVTEKERFEGGDYPSFSRIDIVKTELQRTLQNLDSFVNFNIIAFATDLNPWKARLMPANILNKSAAKEWVGRLLAIGGASKEDLAQVGLVGSANLDKGKTNTHGALMTALGVKPGARTGDRDYATTVDTIFFLSDGRPTVGDYVDPDDILREVAAVNELRKVVIHTIAIGEFQKDFMRRMAEENGGVFVDLGK